MRLLVVEDEKLLRQQLEQGLVKQGYVVDAAEDGKVGLYYATEYSYDAAIIDIGLPEIDGWRRHHQSPAPRWAHGFRSLARRHFRRASAGG